MSKSHSAVRGVDDSELASSSHLTTATAAAFELLARPWTPHILWVLLHGPMHFNELDRAIPRMSREMLRQRLKALVNVGIVVRTVHPGKPATVAYSLTPVVEDLREPFDGIDIWARGTGSGLLIASALQLPVQGGSGTK